MSHITQVKFSGIKGTHATVPLFPITAIIGGNHSNKTTIVDAIQIALLGYHPKQKKTNAEMMNLATANDMSVQVTFADGRQVSRDYKGDGRSVTSTVTPKDFQVDPRLALCLDPTLYFGKTEAERVQRVIDLSEGLGSAERVPAFIARLKLLKAAEHTAEAEEQLANILTEMPPYSPRQTVQVWLGQLLEWVKENYKAANATLKGFDQTSRTLTEANSIDTLNNETSPESIRQRLLSLRAKEKELNEATGQLRAQAAQAAKDLARKTTLQQQLQSLPELDPYLIPQAEEKLAKCRASFDALGKQQATLSAKATELTQANRRTAVEVERLKSEVRNCEAAILATNQRVAQKQAKIAEVENLGCCPYCRSSQEGWSKVLIDTYTAELQEIQKNVAPQGEAKAAAEAKWQAAAQRYQNETDEINKLLDSVEEMDAQRNELGEEIDRINEQITSARTAALNLTNVRQQLAAFPETIEVPKVEEPADLSDLRRQIFEAESALEVLTAQESERKRIAQVTAAAAGARARVDLLKQVGETVKDEQAKLVEGAFAPALALANLLLQGILPSPLCYYAGLVGRRHQKTGKFCPVSTFSGSEERATFAAITAALGQTAPDRLAIVDEIGTFDRATRAALLKNVCEVVAFGKMDQVLLLGTELLDDIPPQIKVINIK